MVPASPAAALQLLRDLGAPKRLVQHHALVAEAAGQLIDDLDPKYLRHVDRDFVLVGAALHDAGKILHPHEMAGPGDRHEADGRDLLLRHGVEPRLARVCVTHAAWTGSEVTLNERLIALADKLWKGKRVEALEESVIRELSDHAKTDFWDAFVILDQLFEQVAAQGDDRLRRSTVGA